MPSEDTQFKPGKSGNPGGRPKGSINLITILRRKLSEGDGKRAEQIIDNLLDQAADADPRALGFIKEVLDRHEGAVSKRQEIEVTGGQIKVVKLAGDEDDDEGGEGQQEDS